MGLASLAPHARRMPPDRLGIRPGILSQHASALFVVGSNVVPTSGPPLMLEHRFAKLAALAKFVLLVIGGTVNPTGSSLACPEPTIVCHGRLFPPMVGGVLYEHGHRLAAMTVGLLQIALTLVLLRRGLRRLGWILL